MKNAKEYYIVLDFEANCSSKEDQDHEIIEFPMILIKESTGEMIDQFHQYVKPLTQKHISPFIQELTHITDQQINEKGITWDQCLTLIDQWFSKNNLTTDIVTVITCGDWDLNTMLPRQLKLSRTVLSYNSYQILSTWLNIKKPFKKWCQWKEKSCSFINMMIHLDLEIEGHHHSGIDDSKNIAKIARELSKLGADMTQPNRKKVIKTVEF